MLYASIRLLIGVRLTVRASTQSDDSFGLQLLIGNCLIKTIPYHVYRSGRANWISLRFLFPRCDLGVSVACCYGQQLSWSHRLIIQCALKLISCGRWHLGIQIRNKDRITRNMRMSEKKSTMDNRRGQYHQHMFILFLMPILLLLVMTTFIAFQSTCLATRSGLIQSRSVSIRPVLHTPFNHIGLLLLSHK